jgi:eukaryotic translation initiation factor 2C
LDVKFHQGASLAPGWAVMVIRDGPPAQFPLVGPNDARLARLIQEFKAKMLKAGMTAAADPNVFSTEHLPGPRLDPDRRQSLAFVRQALISNLDRNRKPSFVLVLLVREDEYIYPGLKRFGDVELGVNTTCMLLLPKKALLDDPKKRDQYYSNVALKVRILVSVHRRFG